MIQTQSTMVRVPDRFDEILAKIEEARGDTRRLGVSLEETQSSVELIAEQYGEIKATLNKHTEILDSHTEAIAEIKVDITILKEDVAVLKKDVSVLKEDVAILKDDVVGLKVDMRSVKNVLGMGMAIA